MTDDNRKFKKQWVNRKGEIENVEYTLPKKTINEELSEDIENTKKIWQKQSIFTATDNFQEQIKSKMGKYFKYIRKMKDGSIKARMGGVLMKITDEYMMLLNPKLMTAWSIQYKDIIILYETPKEKDDDEDEPESKRIAKQQKEIKKQLRKEKREKVKKEKEEKREKREKNLKEKLEKEEKKADAPEKLTDEEAEAVLKKAYYEENFKFGRDKLYATLKSNGHNITRKQVNDWLKKQVSVCMETAQKDDIKKGDRVRVSMSKGNDKKTKQYRTNWSQELFLVKKVMRGKGLKLIQYKIEDTEGQPIKGMFKREEIHL